MGHKSTYDIERSTTLEIIQSRLQELDNQALASILEVFSESYFRNYDVVDFFDGNEDRVIKSSEDFINL